MKYILLTLFTTLFLFAQASPSNVQDNNSLYENIIKVELEKKSNIFKPNVTHSLVTTYKLNDNEILFLISSNTANNVCHSCTPIMNWFHLKKDKSDNWIIINKILNRDFKYGSYGEFPTPEMIKIGENTVAFKYIFSFLQNGVSQSELIIESYENMKFSKILEADLSYSDAGVYDEGEEENNWESSFDIIESHKKYNDLVMITKGIENKKQFERKDIYRFSNGKYKIIEDKK